MTRLCTRSARINTIFDTWVQYPVLDINFRAKLSSACYNTYIQSRLALSDFEDAYTLRTREGLPSDQLESSALAIDVAKERIAAQPA